MRKLTVNQAIESSIWTTGICTNHTGKMQDMTSISTSCKNNSFCAKMSQIKGTVCEKCYAQRQMKCYKSMNDKYTKSFEELTTKDLQNHELPHFDNSVNVVRIEAFGELQNVRQAKNYIKIILANPFINFAWWTKRPEIISKAMKEMQVDELENCNVIYSNPHIDTVPKIRKYSFIKGYFSVWKSAEKAIENGQTINCGSKKCKNCLKCYDANDGIFFINELLK